tara:strand:+ start:255907 stop:256335 length:429 start_codon:yes stop_codon:yes gene_type:complete
MATLRIFFFLIITAYPGIVIEMQSQQLEVRVTGIEPDKGVIRVCLFDKEEHFFNKAGECKVKPAPTDGHTISVRFENDFNKVKYAIAVYQDINNNGKLDRNWMGIPTEPYGFSNNPSTFFGPPSFHKAAFEIAGKTSITIKL